MKKLLLLLPLCLIGCSKATHDVLCMDDALKGNKAITTFEGEAYGNVYTVYISGTTYLTFITPNKNRVILDLSKNDCGVN